MGSPTLTLLLSVFCVGCLAKSHNRDEFIDIFPPKWHSGDIMKTTKHADIDNALDDVHRAASILESRSVAIGIACDSGGLNSPKTRLKDGVEQSTLPEAFTEGETLLALFKKYYVGVVGVYGMMTYNIQDTDLMLAIMFSVPFDSIVYSIKYNMKIYPNNLAVNDDLIEHMLNYGSWRPQGYQHRTEYGVNMTGSMTDNRRSKLIVRISSKGADVSTGPHREVGCDTKGVLPGKKCWVECDLGFCWTEYSCETVVTCSQNMPCTGKCEI